MSSTEQAPEPTMDEILASIRRIIADDEATSGSRPAPKAAGPALREPERPRPRATPASLVDDIAQALRADEEMPAREPEDDILDLTEAFEADRPEPAPALEHAPLAMPEAEEPQPRAPVWESPIPPAPAHAEPQQPHVQAEPARDFPREPIAEVAAALAVSAEAERSFMGYQEEPLSEPEEPRFEDDVEVVEAPPAPASFIPEAPAESWQKNTRNGAAPQSLEDSVREMLRPLLRDWLDNNLPRILESAVREELAAQVRERHRKH